VLTQISDVKWEGVGKIYDSQQSTISVTESYTFERPRMTERPLCILLWTHAPFSANHENVNEDR